MLGLDPPSLPTVPPPTRQELERLRQKYVRLRELRSAVGLKEAHEVRGPLRELAKEFPGSLREIDVLSSERIQERALELTAATPAPEWARVTHAYHVLMRLSLWLKAELGSGAGPRDLAVAVEQQFGVACTAQWVERVKKPPRGRLNDLVFEALAAQFQRSELEVRRLIFPRGNMEAEGAA